jgi:hypothetical protein
MTDQEKSLIEQDAIHTRNVKLNFRTLSLEYASKANPMNADVLIQEAQVIYDWLIKEL